MRGRNGLLIALLLCVPAIAGAQIVQRPARPTRGLFGGGAPADPTRARHDLSMTASVLGGYDDYLTPSGATGPQLPSETAASGWVGTAETSLNYFFGRAAQFVSVDGRAVSNTYSGSGTGSTFGGAVELTGSAELGSRNTLAFHQDVVFVPSLVLGTTPSDIGSGVLDQRSRTSTTGANLARRWTARQTSAIDASYGRQTFLDEFGNSTATFAGSFQHTWNLTRVVGLTGSYRFSDAQLGSAGTDDGSEIPLRQHALEGGVSYSRRLSPSRTLRFSGTMGATRAETLDTSSRAEIDYWTPSGHLSVGTDLGRTWMLSANYSRQINVLPGVTRESFAANEGSVVANGTISPRIEAALGVNFSSGQTGGAESPGTFAVYSGMAQLRYAIARCCAATVNYDYSYYKVEGVSDTPTALPPQYDRNAFRVGLTLWLPLHGSSNRGGGANVR